MRNDLDFMKKVSSTTVIFVAVFAVLAALIGVAVWQNVKPTGLDDFAKCLTENGAKVREAWWCPHCKEQRADFGPSYKYVDSTECGAGQGQFNLEACPGLESTPEWSDSEGNVYKGRQSLETLSETFGCELPEGFNE